MGAMRIAVAMIAFVALTWPALAAEPDWLNPELPSIGVTVIAVSDVARIAREEKLTLPAKIGVIVRSAVPGGPATLAKIGPLDVITKIDRKPIRDLAEFSSLMNGLAIGKSAQLSGFDCVEKANGKLTFSPHVFKATPQRAGTLCLNALTQGVDEVENSVSLTHPATPKLTDKSDISISIENPFGPAPTLMMHVQHVERLGGNFLNIQGVTIKADRKKWASSELDAHLDTASDVNWEWFGVKVNDALRETLIDVIDSGTGTIRLSGFDYKKDRELSDDETSRLFATLVAYEELLFQKGQRRFEKKEQQ
jgi:hypothetical protein